MIVFNDQTDPIERMQLLPDDVHFDAFCSSRGALAWITHTRSEIACYANEAAQVTESFWSAARQRVQQLHKVFEESSDAIALQAVKHKHIADPSIYRCRIWDKIRL